MSDYIVGYLDKLEKFAQSKVERIAELERENAELRKDKERLDWLAITDVWFDEPATESYTPETFRAEIDRKRKDNP